MPSRRYSHYLCFCKAPAQRSVEFQNRSGIDSVNADCFGVTQFIIVIRKRIDPSGFQLPSPSCLRFPRKLPFLLRRLGSIITAISARHGNGRQRLHARCRGGSPEEQGRPSGQRIRIRREVGFFAGKGAEERRNQVRLISRPCSTCTTATPTATWGLTGWENMNMQLRANSWACETSGWHPPVQEGLRHRLE